MKQKVGNVKFILGKAGTGKTYLTIQSLKEMNKNILCLAYTHSAVNNMKDKLMSQNSLEVKSKFTFMTVHKYLKLPITKIVYHKLKDYLEFDIIVIDEFTLIPLDIINILFYLSDKRKSTQFIFIGDLLQLPCIEKKTKNPRMVIKQDIPHFKKSIDIDFNEAIDIINHLNKTIYFSKYFINNDKLILKYNYRQNEYCGKIIYDILVNKNIKLIDRNELKELKNEGYTVLASRYKYLETIYLFQNDYYPDTESSKTIDSKIGPIKVNLGDELVANESIEEMDLLNGEIYKVNDLNDELLLKHSKQLLPKNYLTVHKAQGKTINKIIVCVDGMFELTMFYTALTRAKEDIKLFSISTWDEKMEDKLNTEMKIFNNLENVIYNN